MRVPLRHASNLICFTKRLRGLLLLVICGVSTSSLNAQTRPQQVPLSGRTGTAGNVTVTQQPTGGGNSVDTISTSVQVGNSFSGSVIENASAGFTHVLNIEEAIRRGLAHNLGLKSASQTEKQAMAAQIGSRSALLPTISGQLSETVTKTDLTATGFDPASFPAIGQYFPNTIGPYHYYSALANFSQDVFDLVAIRNLAVSKKQTEAAKLGSADAREQVILAVTGIYLRVLSSKALVASEDAQVKYSQSIYDHSAAQEEAGAKAHVEVNRNLVQLQTEKQRLIVDQALLVKDKMSLARMIGLSIDEEFDATDVLSPDVVQEIGLSDAYRRAIANRPDLRAAEIQLVAAEDARKAASSERVPNLKLQGYYGVQGKNPNSGASVYNGTVQLNIPIFSGGQIRSDERSADAVVGQRRNELSDTKEQVRFDVRSAWIDRDVAAKQVPIADSNRKLAGETLQQSNDRFLAGATTSVEVIQAEQAVASAERDYISSLFSLNLAKINLARAMGEAERDIPTVLRGAQ